MLTDSPEHALSADELLHLFLSHEGTPLDFAQSIGITLEDLFSWWDAESTQASLRKLESLSAHKTRLLAQLHAPAALSAITKLTTDPNRVERRRAAALILRQAQLRPAKHPSRNRPPVAHDTSPAPETRPDRDKSIEHEDSPEHDTADSHLESPPTTTTTESHTHADAATSAEPNDAQPRSPAPSPSAHLRHLGGEPCFPDPDLSPRREPDPCILPSRELLPPAPNFVCINLDG